MSTSVTTTPMSSLTSAMLSSTQDSASTTVVSNAVTTDLDTTTEDSVTVETSTTAFSNMNSSSDSPSTQTFIPSSYSSLFGSSSTRSVSSKLSSTFAQSRSTQPLKTGSTNQVTLASRSPVTVPTLNNSPTTNANKISTTKSPRPAISTSTKPSIVSKPPYSALSTTAFTKVTTRAQQNTIGAAVISAGTTTQNQCGNPPAISGGSVTSKGPYYAGVARVVYTCLSGYTLSGTASVLCGINRQWGPTPQCISLNKEHTGLEEELSGLPLWMAIIIGVAVGLICLLLLICLLGLCFRLFGCWKGSWFGSEPKRSSVIYPELLHPPAPSQVTKATSMMAVKETGNKPNHSMLTDRYAKRPDINLSGNGRPPDDHQLTAQMDRNVSTQYNRPGFSNGSSKEHRGNFMAPPLVNVNYSVPLVRRQAKRPTGKWMPHSNGLRGYNTSTK